MTQGYAIGWYKFETDYFGKAIFEGRNAPCISAKGQKVFHTGYELRDVDKHDIKNIEKILGESQNRKYQRETFSSGADSQ